MGRSPGSEAATALTDTVRLLWPEAEVELVRRPPRPERGRGRRDRGGRDQPDPVPVAELVVVPHARAPRLLLPARPARAAAGAMLRFSAETPRRETAGRLGIAALLRCGGVAAFGDRVLITGTGAGSLADHLAEVLGEPVVVSLGIGSARVNRKPVLQVFDAHGRALAFVKVGLGPVAHADVTAETAALARLGGRPWRHLAVPAVRYVGDWRGSAVLVLSVLPSAPPARPDRAARIPHRPMRELTEAFAAPSTSLAESSWLAGLREAAGGLADRRTAGRFTDCLDRLERLAGDRPQPVGAWHGDWTPWNMASPGPGGGRRLQVWDWERFETGVPQGLDPCHYAVNVATRRGGTSAATIRSGLAAAGADRLAGGRYLAAILGRYLPLTEVAHGDRIAPRAATFLSTLEAWVTGP